MYRQTYICQIVTILFKQMPNSDITNKIVIAVLLLLIICAVLYVVIFVNRLYKDKQRIEARRRHQEELDRELYGEDDYLAPPKK